MKKCLAILFALTLLWTSFSVLALDTITVSAGEAEAPLNGTARVPVTLADNPGMVALQLKVVFDPEKLELVSVEDGGLLGEDVKHSPENASLSWENYLHEGDFYDNGVICTLVFRVKSGAEGETIPVALEKSTERYAAMNMGLENIAVALVPGGVTVRGETSAFPWIPVGIGVGATLILAAVCAAVILKKKGCAS